MDIVHFFVAAYGVHIGVKSRQRFEMIFMQGVTFPFCERMYHFGKRSRRFDVETHRSFHTVQVVVKSASGVHEQRTRHS